MLYKRGVCRHAVSVCLSVCLSVSVTFMNSVKTNKHIYKIFTPSGSQAILVFSCQRAWQYSDRNPLPLTEASNAGGVGRNRDSEHSASLSDVNAATGQVLSIRRRQTAVP